MCSTSNEQIIRDVIADKVSKNNAFTAFDITMQSKKKGMDDRHRNVKEIIHQILWDEYPSYQKALIDVPGAPVQPFLYFPQGYDINDYIPMDREELFEHVDAPKDNSDEDEDEDEENWYDDDDDEIDPLW